MFTSRLAVRLLTFTMCFLFAGTTSVFAKNLRIGIRTLYCDQTTEPNHDEIYFLVSASLNGSVSTGNRAPFADGDADSGKSWDFNDSGGKSGNQDRWLHYRIYDAPLQPGEQADIRIAFMESDGTNNGQIVAILGALAQNSGEPLIQATGVALSTVAKFLPPNEDDILGALALRVNYRNDGSLVWDHNFRNNIDNETFRANTPDEPQNPNGVDNTLYVRLRNLDGGGGNYRLWLTITIE
jgi:hypothetical protein